MREFDYISLKYEKWDAEIVGYIASIHEMKGKQDIYAKINPEILDTLVEIAKVQSTETSNSIEGIRTTSARLQQLVAQKTTPRNRDEEEIAGYRDVLNIIHESHDYIPLNANYILQLHSILYHYSTKAIGGKFKNVQNYISGVNADGQSYTIFTPLAPYETPAAIDQICEQFNRAIAEGEVDPLILIPTFIHDFLCIHPFLDGNGRMSRLLTTLLLYRCGYSIGKYISLEAKIAKNKELYYQVLEDSQHGWHEGQDDASKFIKYILGTIISAYRELEERFAVVGENLAAIDIVRNAIKTRIGKFTKSEILELCPTLGSSSVESSLKKLCETAEIKKGGTGKNTFYIRGSL